VGRVIANDALIAARTLGLAPEADPRRDGLWRANCPLCVTHSEHALQIRESVRGAHITVHCKTGCEPTEILQRLACAPLYAPQTVPTSPSEILERSRVDVIGMIDAGIPDREYVPGARGLLAKGKRVHVSAEKKTGKSLSMAVVMPVQIVAAGGTVVVLDRENGADEFARRLEAVLDAQEADKAFRGQIRERLRYHAWPTLRLDWREDPAYPEAFGDVDVVIFDSSRSHLTPLGLKEDASDDFAAFTSALLDPLMQTGKTTVTLDNMGHEAKERARGTSAKEDLCDVAFTMRAITPFSSSLAGRLELRCTASRLGEVGGTWQMELGAGHYGTWKQIGARPPEAREDLREAALDVLRAEAMGVNRIAKAIRERPGNALRFSDRDLRAGLEAWSADPASGVLSGPAGKGFTSHGGTSRHDARGEDPTPRRATDSAAMAETPANTGDMPMAGAHATARHGTHGGDGVSLRDATAATPSSENGQGGLPEGWSIEDAEAIAAEHEEVG
jgi:hypothetical protein